MRQTQIVHYELDPEERRAVAQVCNEIVQQNYKVVYWSALFTMIEQIYNKRGGEKQEDMFTHDEWRERLIKSSLTEEDIEEDKPGDIKILKKE